LNLLSKVLDQEKQSESMKQAATHTETPLADKIEVGCCNTHLRLPACPRKKY
jgi:hypothetical protein